MHPLISNIRSFLEAWQIIIYFMVIGIGIAFGLLVEESSTTLESAINPALVLMLFVTFLQVPLIEIAKAFRHLRFIAALLISNFIVLPLFVALLSTLLPNDPQIRFAVLLVLFAPCVDYVITFTQAGRGNAQMLLAMTPILLLVQMLLLPIYLAMLLGEEMTSMLDISPFFWAFIWFIALPLIAAAIVQFICRHSSLIRAISDALGVLPVPATALVLLLVLSSLMPQIGLAREAAAYALPIYISYAIGAPIFARGVTKVFNLDKVAGKAVCYSASYRNSLILLPLALAVPGGMPIIPAVILTQTLVELCFLPIYLYCMPKLFGAQN